MRHITHNPQPATRNPQPATRNPQPATRNPQPTTRNPQPTTHNPQPTTRNPQPATRNPQPATRNPQPTTHNPQPTTHNPQPATRNPAFSSQVCRPHTDEKGWAYCRPTRFRSNAMSSIQVSGLSSGFDWTSLVTTLVNADRVPETAWKNSQVKITSQLGAFTTLSGQLTNLKTAVAALQDPSVFTQHTVTAGNTALGWDATAAAVPNGQYTVAVTQFATTASIRGASNVGRGLSSSNNVSSLTIGTLPTATPVTAGNFQINGATVSVSATDSLQDVFARINTATNGAVTASYNSATDRVSFQSNTASPVVLGAANDTSNFLSALQLSNNGTTSVSSARDLGSAQLFKPLAQSHLLAPLGSSDATGNDSFQVNGVAIAYNANTDSLSTVMGRINASSAGVTAAYDPSTDRFSLTNNTTGNVGLSASDTTGGLLKAMGITTTGGASVVSGVDANYSFNGGATTVSHSNTFADANGLSVTATGLGTQTITVGSDTSSAATAIDNFITAYNTVQSNIATQTKISSNADGTVTSALFAGNPEMRALGSSLRSMVFGSVPGLNGGASLRLQNIGIDFASGTSQLTVTDPAAFAKALSTNGAATANLFQNSTNGLATQLNSFVTKTTGSDGIISTQTGTLNKRNAAYTAQIAALEVKLAVEQAALTAEFTQMERIQAQIKNEAATLAGAFGGTAATSSSSTVSTIGKNGTATTIGTSGANSSNS